VGFNGILTQIGYVAPLKSMLQFKKSEINA